jgi:hypothetical protein
MLLLVIVIPAISFPFVIESVVEQTAESNSSISSLIWEGQVNLDVKVDSKQEVPLMRHSPSAIIADVTPNLNSLPKSEPCRGRSRGDRKQSLLTHEVSVYHLVYISNTNSQPKSGYNSPSQGFRASLCGCLVRFFCCFSGVSMFPTISDLSKGLLDTWHRAVLKMSILNKATWGSDVKP